ncbi:MAG TPA: hypothetical protein PK304_02790 [Mobilitalea sp.]|nr:hypothetical protein [Mobilitalea sp.]
MLFIYDDKFKTDKVVMSKVEEHLSRFITNEFHQKAYLVKEIHIKDSEYFKRGEEAIAESKNGFIILNGEYYLIILYLIQIIITIRTILVFTILFIMK